MSLLLTAKFPNAALAARCTSVSWLLSKKRIGSRVSRPTGRTSFSVISANARAALRCKSTLSEKDSVVKADSGDPEKKLVVVRSVTHIDSGAQIEKRKVSHFLGIAVNRPPLLSHFPVIEVHRIATCALGLMSCLSKRTMHSQGESLQHDSQQLAMLPMRNIQRDESGRETGL